MISLLQLLTCFLFATACISLVLQLVFVCFYHTILGFWGTRRVSGTRRIRGRGQILTRNGVRGGCLVGFRVRVREHSTCPEPNSLPSLVAPVLCQLTQRLVFEISVAPSLGTRWHRFSLKFVTASIGKSGVYGVFFLEISTFNSNG
jgi:hypothetical protein